MQRRLGIINVGGDGTVVADGESFTPRKVDCVYPGKGVKSVQFASKDATAPAVFLLVVFSWHRRPIPNRLMKKEEASPTDMGEVKTANRSVPIYKYIHADGESRVCPVGKCGVDRTGGRQRKEHHAWHIRIRAVWKHIYFDTGQSPGSTFYGRTTGNPSLRSWLTGEAIFIGSLVYSTW